MRFVKDIRVIESDGKTVIQVKCATATIDPLSLQLTVESVSEWEDIPKS